MPKINKSANPPKAKDFFSLYNLSKVSPAIFGYSIDMEITTTTSKKTNHKVTLSNVVAIAHIKLIIIRLSTSRQCQLAVEEQDNLIIDSTCSIQKQIIN